MKAINPFLVLGVDEAAPRAEIDAAHRRLIVENHPDRFATAPAEDQWSAAQRTAEINDAYLLLTDPDYASRNKRKFDRVRAAGIPVEPAPKRHPDAAEVTAGSGSSGTADYREAAGREFNVSTARDPSPWVAPVRRRRFGRR